MRPPHFNSPPLFTGEVFNTIDRAVFAETLRPFGATLAVMMAALLMERLLRLLRLVTSGGGPLDLVGWMALNLIPHYLGLALPAALFLAVYSVVGRMAADHELDALRGAGVSVRRVSRSFLLLGLLAAAVNLAVVGWLQPLGRYGYRALAHSVSQEVWDMTLPERTLIEVAEGVHVSAEQVLAGGQRLLGVFVRQEQADGAVSVATARGGRIVLTEDATRARIQLAGGVLVRREPDGEMRSLKFNRLTDVVTVRVAPVPFRDRGAEERELTLPELAGALDSDRRRSEYNARLARILSVAFVPMLAVGVGLAAMRAPRGTGLLAGALGLFLFHHLLLTGEGMVDTGRLPAGPAIWGPAAAFAAAAAAAFLRLDRRAGA